MKGELFDMPFFGLNMVYCSRMRIQIAGRPYEESKG